MKHPSFLLLLPAGLWLSGLGAFAETPTLIAIKNARIVTVSGPVIAKGTVVIRDGLIEAVGDSVVEPAGAWVVEGEGLTVYPGLIDGLNTLGLPGATPVGQPTTQGRRGTPPDFPGPPDPSPSPSPTPAPSPAPAPSPVAIRSAAPSAPPARGPEDRPSNTSYLLAADQIDASDRRLEAARNAGFTGSVSFPTRGIFAGHGAVINLAGRRPGQMVVQSPAGLFLTLRSGGFGGGFPGSPMGVIAYIRQIFLDAGHYKMAQEIYAQNPRGLRRPDYDKTLEGVLVAPRVLLPASDRKEIDRMLRFAAELKLNAVLYGAHEAYNSTGILKQQRVPVLVNLRWPERSREPDPEAEESLRILELRDKAPSSAAALAKAGVPFAFFAGGLERPSDVPRAVKKAMDAGLSPADAVRALTLSVAEIFGVADRLGSIEKGKIANLIVTKGDLFQERTETKYVFVDGVKFEPAAETPAVPTEVTR